MRLADSTTGAVSAISTVIMPPPERFAIGNAPATLHHFELAQIPFLKTAFAFLAFALAAPVRFEPYVNLYIIHVKVYIVD
ncbi:hypothetical protein [Rhizobium sophoriradicis]|uniref:hypothetical protein n=1 Tax=Rhizobium sophoriradicis TaxID=1535245 RepID=UPI001482995F|nr:hypothetical protein [Rhizobium sophoriradicis]